MNCGIQHDRPTEQYSGSSNSVNFLYYFYLSDAMAYRGDLISCEVDFDHATNGTFPVVFFLNGREVARASMKRKSGQSPPFPFIAMGYKGIRVLTKVCPV